MITLTENLSTVPPCVVKIKILESASQSLLWFWLKQTRNKPAYNLGIRGAITCIIIAKIFFYMFVLLDQCRNKHMN